MLNIQSKIIIGLGLLLGFKIIFCGYNVLCHFSVVFPSHLKYRERKLPGMKKNLLLFWEERRLMAEKISLTGQYNKFINLLCPLLFQFNSMYTSGKLYGIMHPKLAKTRALLPWSLTPSPARKDIYSVCSDDEQRGLLWLFNQDMGGGSSSFWEVRLELSSLPTRNS